jgi:hypothetical protein
MPSNWCKYILRNAYPTNLIAVPVSYEGANILRTTVTFNYDLYRFEKSNGFPINGDGGNLSSNSGGDQLPSPLGTPEGSLPPPLP